MSKQACRAWKKRKQSKADQDLSSDRVITVPAECWRQIHTQASPPMVLERELGQPPPKKECWQSRPLSLSLNLSLSLSLNLFLSLSLDL